jgi:hypothetical protein
MKMSLELHDELKKCYRRPADVPGGDDRYDAGDVDDEELAFMRDLQEF